MAGRAAFTELAGKTVKQARRRMVELLTESGDLRGDPEPITHIVKFYEKGDRPLEIVTSRQWYIRNGGRDPEATRGTASPREGDPLDPRLHAGSVRALGERAHR